MEYFELGAYCEMIIKVITILEIEELKLSLQIVFPALNTGFSQRVSYFLHSKHECSCDLKYYNTSQQLLD